MKFTLSLLLCALPVLPAFSQNIVIRENIVAGAVLENMPPEMQAAMARAQAQAQNLGTQAGAKAGAQSADNQKDPEAHRKELLSKLKFDRSPSGILAEERKVRQEAPPAADKKGEEKKPAEPDPGAAPLDEAAQKAKEKAQEKAQEQEALRKKYEKEVADLRQDIVLGEWKEVTAYLAALPKELGESTFLHILKELGKPVKITPLPELRLRGAKPHQQKPYLSTDDIIALADAGPTPPSKEAIKALAKLLPSDPPRRFYQTLKEGLRHFGKRNPEEQLRTSTLLLDAKLVKPAGDFLPDLALARETGKTKALNTLARYHAEAHQADLEAENLPLAWELSLEVMSHPKAEIAEKGEALYRALALVPELEEGAGQDWLRKTFAEPSGEGFNILAAVGTLGSQSVQIRNASFRLEQIKLQQSAAEALLATDGIDLGEWKEILTIYALNWLKEAEITQRYDQSESLRPQMQFDNFGNSYYAQRQFYQNNDRDRPNPIPAGEIIEIAPSQAWIESVDANISLRLLESIPRLFLKVKEHEKAFPFIKSLASEKPETAQELTRSLISIWAEAHNPNRQDQYRSRYSYFYGYNNAAGSIPLTRSKQERNLKELAVLVENVKELKLGEDFNQEFADAFIMVHSRAEVWRLEALQQVFGKVTNLGSDTIATLMSRMRINLAALWPNPKVQEQEQTKRKDKELHAQVLTGYNTAREVTAEAWGEEPSSARLLTQLAAITYEESNYLSALKPQSTHSTTKRTALDDFAEAAKLYAAKLPLEDPSEESAEVYEVWFYAALGSPLLEALKNHHQPVTSEFPKIKAALDALPDKERERHYKMLASTLDQRLSNVSPDLKFRYLEAALQVVGRHPDIEKAGEVYDYYEDLVTEIELRTFLAGSPQVGTEPFGLHVNLHHTKEIERESGGFQRYLQNQNNSTSYSYNFGRPTEDYRDKFEKAARAALEEHFEVISLTFHTDKIESRTSSRVGWRVTPYAYFLLRAKGPQVDTVPPLKIDLDFQDTSGYVVLPISSANVALDASQESLRPLRNLKMTLTLDERQVEEKGHWNLEIKTSAQGLVPQLEQLLELPPKGFQVVATDDRELLIEELTTETDDGAPVSSHEYRLMLKPEGNSPAQFTFPALTKLAKDSLAKEDALLRQRYQDVDLIPVGETFQLTESSRSSLWWWLAVLCLALAGLAVWFWFKKNQASQTETIIAGPAPPENLTPVTLLHWLKSLSDRVPQDKASELSNEIDRLEQLAFSAQGQVPELNDIASRWQTATN